MTAGGDQLHSGPVASWRLSFAEFGIKRGATRSMKLLPEAFDLPGEGWQQLSQRTWYTGRFRSDAAWLDRARRNKSVAATRWFANSRTHHRFVLSVYPLASEEDALTAVTKGPSLRSTATTFIDQECVVNDVLVPTSPATRASQQSFRLKTGEPVGARFLRACEGSVLFSVVGSGCQHEPEPPPWNEMVSIAEGILGRIAQHG
jgi:hypothetical protein